LTVGLSLEAMKSRSQKLSIELLININNIDTEITKIESK
jgi:hypothetical protein